MGVSRTAHVAVTVPVLPSITGFKREPVFPALLGMRRLSERGAQVMDPIGPNKAISAGGFGAFTVIVVWVMSAALKVDV